MSREVRRVPSGFDWPLKKTWEGYFMPDFLQEKTCPDCENGYGPEAWQMHLQWYGNAPFDPRSTGSEPFPHTHPKVRAFAERNVGNAAWYYGSGEEAIIRESKRLAGLWNSYWQHHLSQEDVDAQVADGQLREMTHRFDPSREGMDRWVPLENVDLSAAAVNEFYLGSFLGGPSNWVAINTRCEREGFEVRCQTCKGHGSVEAWKGQRKAAKKWKPTKPPKGKAWQIWETTSEGSPVTPAFDTPEALAAYWAKSPRGTEYNNALAWIVGPGWAPTGIGMGDTYLSADEFITEVDHS